MIRFIVIKRQLSVKVQSALVQLKQEQQAISTEAKPINDSFFSALERNQDRTELVCTISSIGRKIIDSNYMFF